MSGTLVVQHETAKGWENLITYPYQETKLVEIADEYRDLTISGVDDTAGYEKVHKSRMKLVKIRTSIDKQRKATNADAKEFITANNERAKELLAITEPVEKLLQDRQKAIDDEKEAIKRAAEQASREALQARIDKLAAVGCVSFSPTSVEGFSDDEFHETLAQATESYNRAQVKAAQEKAALEERERRRAERIKALVPLGCELPDDLADMDQEYWDVFLRAAQQAHEAEQERKAAQRAALEAEAARQEAEAEKQRKEREALEAEQKKIDDARRQLEAEQQAARHREEMRIAAEQAAERARAEAEAKAAREAAAEKQRIADEQKRQVEEAARAAEEAARQEAMRPDREKLLSVADAVEFLDVPEVSVQAANLRREVADILVDAAGQIRNVIKRG